MTQVKGITMPEARTQAEDKTKTEVSAATPTATIASAAQAQPAASDDEKAKAEAAANEEVERHPSKGLFVLYLGPSNIARAVENDEFKTRGPLPGEGTIAEITAAQWGEAGVGSSRKETHTWDLSNEWRLPATQFTQAQIDYLLTNSQRFALVDAEGKLVDSES